MEFGGGFDRLQVDDTAAVSVEMWIDAISNRELGTQQRRTGNTSIKDELLHHCREAQKSCVSLEQEQVETGVRWGKSSSKLPPSVQS